MFAFVPQHLKRLGIVVGVVFSILGSVGTTLWIAPLHEHIKELSDFRDVSARHVAELANAESIYFMANQQGDLIFMLGLQTNSRPDLADKIYAGNLLDRATPIRNMIGALALAKALDYRATYDAYEKLNQSARESLSFERYTAVKSFEREIVSKAETLIASLNMKVLSLEAQLNAAEASAKTRQVIAFVLTLLGTCSLLLANLARD
jgi:hypothetical protein